jgi:hypothetical protein
MFSEGQFQGNAFGLQKVGRDPRPLPAEVIESLANSGEDGEKTHIMSEKNNNNTNIIMCFSNFYGNIIIISIISKTK